MSVESGNPGYSRFHLRKFTCNATDRQQFQSSKSQPFHLVWYDGAQTYPHARYVVSSWTEEDRKNCTELFSRMAGFAVPIIIIINKVPSPPHPP